VVWTPALHVPQEAIQINPTPSHPTGGVLIHVLNSALSPRTASLRRNANVVTEAMRPLGGTEQYNPTTGIQNLRAPTTRTHARERLENQAISHSFRPLDWTLSNQIPHQIWRRGDKKHATQNSIIFQGVSEARLTRTPKSKQKRELKNSRLVKRSQ